MEEHEWRKSSMEDWDIKMMLWNHLTEEQQKTLLLRAMDLKIKHKEMKISMMRDKIRLMEEKLDMMRSVREMIKAGR
jgi:hypothetical protein